MRSVHVAVLLLAFAVGCNSLPAGDRPRDPWREGDWEWHDPNVGAELFYEDKQLREIEFDDDLERIFGDGISDVERRRAGARFSWGSREISGFVQFFAEEIDDFDTSDLNAGTSLRIDDLVGVGTGVHGAPVVKPIGKGANAVFAYRGNISAVFGDGVFRDSNMTTLLASPDEEDDLFYLDIELMAGVGVELYGLRPLIGFYSDFLAGSVDDGIVLDDRNDDLYFGGYNAGLFGEVSYSPPRTPLTAGVRGLVGDVEGVEAFLRVTL